jgi:hypothetical protein
LKQVICLQSIAKWCPHREKELEMFYKISNKYLFNMSMKFTVIPGLAIGLILGLKHGVLTAITMMITYGIFGAFWGLVAFFALAAISSFGYNQTQANMNLTAQVLKSPQGQEIIKAMGLPGVKPENISKN